jgi:hypothetical protein
MKRVCEKKVQSTDSRKSSLAGKLHSDANNRDSQLLKKDSSGFVMTMVIHFIFIELAVYKPHNWAIYPNMAYSLRYKIIKSISYYNTL